jgi:hypothetical protein
VGGGAVILPNNHKICILAFSVAEEDLAGNVRQLLYGFPGQCVASANPGN